MRIALSIALVFVTLAAHAETCGELYLQRNAIYKEQGYCFRTRRAIEAFGNAGCRFDDVDEVPLSARQRHDIAAIQAEERVMGCAQ